ncbi:hypothetical protein B0H13DRAFT_1885382 [Mycena leptocephala]|nr:hypothetical protein B0H13DRAFT_1885382 [Mycena leptocephala]
MSRAQNPEYADPVIREPSPASSPTFERKWEDRLDLRRATRDEELADADPLFPRPSTAVEERGNAIRAGPAELRAKVDELEENELFEQTMLRGSQASLEEETIPKDIDSLMLSMMGPSSVGDTSGNATVTDGPWMQSGNRYEAGAAQARTKGKGKSRK